MTMPSKIWATGVNTNGSWTNEAPRREWDSHAAGYIRADIAEDLALALEEAGDVIECYHKNTGVDLGDASRMPFYKDTIAKVDKALARFRAITP